MDDRFERTPTPSIAAMMYLSLLASPGFLVAPLAAAPSMRMAPPVMQSVAQQAGVSAMPIFHFVKGGELLDNFAGADSAKLVECVAKHK